MTWAAKRIGRPVKWTATRTEAFSATTRGAISTSGRTGARQAGTFSRPARLQRQQSRRLHRSVVPLTKGVEIMTSVIIPPPISAPAASPQYAVDRALPLGWPAGGDLRHGAAGRSRLQAAWLRSGRDPPPELHPEQAMPYANGLGMTYDSGDYAAALTMCWRSPTCRACRTQADLGRARITARRGDRKLRRTATGAPRNAPR